MDNLMGMVNGCEEFKAVGVDNELEKMVRIEELRDMGFTALADKIKAEVDQQARLAKIAHFRYVTITEEKIWRFLDAKVEAYNATRPKPKKKKTESIDSSMRHYYMTAMDSIWYFGDRPKNDSISRNTVDRTSSKDGTVGYYSWTETKIADYKSVPPQDVLETFDVHRKRNLFDYYTIASVNAVKDPLLLGRINGVKDRFYIAQWGDDVTLDDVI